MKKTISLALALTLVFTLAACGAQTSPSGGGTNTPPPFSDSGISSDAAAAPTDDSSAVIGDGSGTYEGETDANGLFSGYGVWIYHNFRYEGYFENGLPNGEGTLYKSQKPGDDPKRSYAVLVTTQGNWIDGYADGNIVFSWHMERGTYLTWEFAVDHGYTSGDITVVDKNEGWENTISGGALFGVPPWANQTTDSSIAAPTGNETELSTTPGGNELPQSPDTSPTLPPPASTSADISELTYNTDTISLSAQINADNTVTYTYANTSLKPSYSSDKAMEYYFTVHGTDSTTSPITHTSFSVRSKAQGDGTHILDLTGILGEDFTRRDIPVTVDGNGLTATWKAPFDDSGVGAELEDLEVFLITHRLIVGGVDVFSEQVKLGMEVMS